MGSINEVVAIVPSAGRGARLSGAKEKPFVLLEGMPIIAHTLEALARSALIKRIILVVARDKIAYASSVLRRLNLKKVSRVVRGGPTRTRSVYNGLAAAGEAEYILIHDGARPFVTKRIIDGCIKGAQTADGAVCALPVTPTIKRTDKRGRVMETLERERLWAVQTPQVFRRDVIFRAYREAIRDGVCATDDAALVERLGGRVKVVEGDYENIKLTVPEDLIFAEAILAHRNWLRHSQV